jgi:cytochrome c oxidase cbb3-type subunit 3
VGVDPADEPDAYGLAGCQEEEIEDRQSPRDSSLRRHGATLRIRSPRAKRAPFPIEWERIVSIRTGPPHAQPGRRKSESALSTEPQPPELPMGIDPVASRRIFFGMLALIAGAALTYSLLKKPASSPPADIVNDPLLVEGSGVYQAQCVSCHGPSGKGDGPIARGLSGPPVGDLTDAAWKHGDRPEQVLAVISKGVPDTAMPAWAGTLGARELRAISAYVFHLAGRKVPETYRTP